VKISNLRLERRPGFARAVASVAWEDGPRPPVELFFQSEGHGAEDLGAEPEAFLAAAVLPAMRDGERRVLVEGALCPVLAEGTAAAIALLGSWYGPGHRPVEIEATEGFRALAPRRPERAAMFFSGGIDSTQLLLGNRSQYPATHPASFVEGLSSFGHLCPATEASRRWNVLMRANLSESAARAGMTLVCLETNIWELAPDVAFLSDNSLSSALAAGAHAFRKRWSAISMASSRDGAHVTPRRGFHPMLDPLWTSSALDLRHSSSRLTRLERLRAILAGPRGVETLVVCLAFPTPPYLNCGECEKCVRTMAALLALGRLSEARHFPRHDVRPEMIAAIPIGFHDEGYWIELVPLLGAIGRADLVAAIESRLAEMKRLELWAADAGWKGRLRRLDRRLFGGRLLRMRRRSRRRI
jgi:hypothetical protein